MGIQTKNGVIYGKVGSVIYRRWRGLNVVQGLPRKVQQSVPSKAAAAEFGLASSSSADLRKFLLPLYKQDDLSMKNRLTRQVLRAIQHSPNKDRLDRDLHDADLTHLNDFQFNENSSLQEALGIRPVARISSRGEASVLIPALSQSGLRYGGEYSVVHAYRLRILAVAMDFRKREMRVLEKVDIDLDGELAEQHLSLCGVQTAGTIVLVGMALYAEQRCGDDILLLNGRSWSPAAILGMGQVEQGEDVEPVDQTEADACVSHTAAPGSSKYSIPAYLKQAYWALSVRPTSRVLVKELELEKGMVLSYEGGGEDLLLAEP